MTTKVSTKLTLRDILSRLNFTQACKLLGDEGKKLIKGGAMWDIKILEDVHLSDDLFRLTLHDTPQPGERTIVTMTTMADARQRLHMHCSACEGMCLHLGAAMALVLEGKLLLGLAAAPKERIPVESLDEDALVRRALEERRERARVEKMKVAVKDSDRPWTDYTVSSGIDELKNRLEVLLGARPEAPVEERMTQGNGAATLHRERVAAAGGELLGAAFKFLGELVAQQSPAAPAPQLTTDLRQGLEACVENDPSGRPRLSFTLPDRAALDQLAATLAQLLLTGQAAK